MATLAFVLCSFSHKLVTELVGFYRRGPQNGVTTLRHESLAGPLWRQVNKILSSVIEIIVPGPLTAPFLTLKFILAKLFIGL